MPCRPREGSRMGDLSVSCLDWLRLNFRGSNIREAASIILDALSLPLDKGRRRNEMRTANELLAGSQHGASGKRPEGGGL
jgi:hypothetical protein